MNIDLLQLTFTVLSIMIPVFATIYTAYSRIRNENRETHKPYLALDEINEIDSVDVYNYHFNFEGKNYSKKKLEHGVILPVSIKIKNIGYGVASNIKFYNLFTGEEMVGTQEKDDNRIQKLFTTLDIATGKEKTIQANVYEDANDIEDYNCVLCVYQDLNGNIYDFIISINVKSDHKYDFYAYQPSSHSYSKCIEANKKAYRQIYKKYSNY